MAAVVFIDTSVLCNLVPVPGRDQDAASVRTDLAARLKNDDQFILPITSVIETGNFIAQVPDGRARRSTAEKFRDILSLIRDEKAPWILHDVSWDRVFLNQFLAGADTGSDYLTHTSASVGAGDLCVLTERALYEARTRVKTTVWSLDAALSAYGN